MVFVVSNRSDCDISSACAQARICSPSLDCPLTVDESRAQPGHIETVSQLLSKSRMPPDGGNSNASYEVHFQHLGALGEGKPSRPLQRERG